MADPDRRTLRVGPVLLGFKPEQSEACVSPAQGLASVAAPEWSGAASELLKCQSPLCQRPRLLF